MVVGTCSRKEELDLHQSKMKASTYQRKNYQDIVRAKRLLDRSPGDNPQPNEYNQQRVKNDIQYDILVPSRDWIDVVCLGPGSQHARRRDNTHNSKVKSSNAADAVDGVDRW